MAAGPLPSRRDTPWLGVLGGMGPAATSFFLERLTALTPATRDQDHLPLIVYADPRTADRSDALLGKGPDPLGQLLTGVRFLDACEVDVIAVPCNSAHAWFPQLQANCRAHIVHIADAAVQALLASPPPAGRVGVLGTEGTLRLGLYQDRLRAAGLDPVVPEDVDEIAALMSAIRSVKSGQVGEGRDVFLDLVARLGERGAERVVVACTDLSVAAAGDLSVGSVGLVDAADALAMACLRLMRPGCAAP